MTREGGCGAGRRDSLPVAALGSLAVVPYNGDGRGDGRGGGRVWHLGLSSEPVLVRGASDGGGARRQKH